MTTAAPPAGAAEARAPAAPAPFVAPRTGAPGLARPGSNTHPMMRREPPTVQPPRPSAKPVEFKSGDYVVCLGAGSITQWAYALPGELEGQGGTEGTA